MPLAIVRVLALIVCGLATALLAVTVTQPEAASSGTPSYSNETEARLSELIQPVFGADTFRVAYNTARPEQVSLLLDATAFPGGVLPIERATLNELVANAVALPQDVVWVEIDYAPFAEPAAASGSSSAVTLALSFSIGVFSLALLWAVTRLRADPSPDNVGRAAAATSTIQHDYADAPSPEKAAALIKSWMREVKPL